MITILKQLFNDSDKFIWYLFLSTILGVLTLAASTNAQGLADGFFRGAGNADITFSSTFENADEFYLGNTKRDIFPFYEEISRTTLSLFIAYGITDNIDVNLNLPYIITDGGGEGPRDQIPPQNFDNIQDGELTIKW